MLKKIVMGFLICLISSGAVWAQTSSDTYYQWGNKLYAGGDYEKSVKYYKAAIQVDPQNWKAYQALGSCEYHQGMKDDAIRDYRQSLAINPNNPSLQNFVNQISGQPALPPAMTASNNNAVSGAQVVGDSRLPKQGSISWAVGFARESLSAQDLVSDYAPAQLTVVTEPVGGEFYFGADYTVSQSFQLGLQGQAIFKSTLNVDTAYFDEECGGLALDAKYLLPLNNDFRLVFTGQVGFYTLVETTYIDSTYSVNDQLDGTSVGGLIGVDIEWVLDHGGWGIDLGIGYRALSFNSITYTTAIGSGSPQTLQNNSGGNFTMDFSGFRTDLGVRFF